MSMIKRIESIARSLVFNGKTFLAVIPARGGSKRLPRKNILDLAGKPLISWSIDAAQRSLYLDKIIVSTDDQEILEISEKFGAEVIIRPDEISSDTASSIDVVIHAVNIIDTPFDYIVLLQPTSPLRTSKNIDEAIELLFEKSANSIISVCKVDHSPLWSNTLPKSGCMDDFIRDEVKGKRSQDLPTYYRLNGAIYIIDSKILVREKSFFTSRGTFSYEMSADRSVDIDEASDFIYASVFIQNENNKN